MASSNRAESIQIIDEFYRTYETAFKIFKNFELNSTENTDYSIEIKRIADRKKPEVFNIVEEIFNENVHLNEQDKYKIQFNAALTLFTASKAFFDTLNNLKEYAFAAYKANDAENKAYNTAFYYFKENPKEINPKEIYRLSKEKAFSVFMQKSRREDDGFNSNQQYNNEQPDLLQFNNKSMSNENAASAAAMKEFTNRFNRMPSHRHINFNNPNLAKAAATWEGVLNQAPARPNAARIAASALAAASRKVATRQEAARIAASALAAAARRKSIKAAARVETNKLGGRYTTRHKHMRKTSSGKKTYKRRKQRKHHKRNTRKR